MSPRPSPYDRLADALPGLGRDPASIRRRVEALERLMEGSFTVPGTNRRFGLDVLLNAVPVIGDLIGTAMGAYMIYEARNLGMSRWQMARMAGNVAIDTALGAVPFVGAIPDFFFRSNTRNLRIIRRHLDRRFPATMTVETPATVVVRPAVPPARS